jgi:hypothetical protein
MERSASARPCCEPGRFAVRSFACSVYLVTPAPRVVGVAAFPFPVGRVPLSFLQRRSRLHLKIHKSFSYSPPSQAQGWHMAGTCLVRVSYLSGTWGVYDSFEQWRFWPYLGSSEDPCRVAALIHQHSA